MCNNYENVKHKNSDIGKKITKLAIENCNKNISNNKIKSVIFELISLTQLIKTQTCEINTMNSWDETFKLQNGGIWLANETGYSDCGVVNISTFKKDIEQDFFWQYHSKRVVTNPEAKGGIIPCNLLEERETLYRYINQEYEMNCKYVKIN
ncbi:MAG: hypothetical protein KDC52_17900 [Ignavibacteriae bacterium]|nr:hypothetical protein [Ignavibacteriota bacterium]